MKFIATCFSVVIISSTVSAQIASIGNCDPNIVSVFNNANPFNSTRFLGAWNEIMRSYNEVENNRICFRLQYNPGTQNTIYNILGTFVRLNGGRGTTNFTVGVLNTNNATFTFSPGFFSDVAPFLILDTDYENFAIVYSCLNSYQGKIEYAWILSRAQRMEPIYFARSLRVLRSRNINLEMIPEHQLCF